MALSSTYAASEDNIPLLSQAVTGGPLGQQSAGLEYPRIACLLHVMSASDRAITAMRDSYPPASMEHHYNAIASSEIIGL
jgi:hypothetical protein